MSRNKYDDAYLMVYHNGYHDVGYLNPYHKYDAPQYHIKYMNGHKDGCGLKRDEEFIELLEEEVARNEEWITMYNTKERV